MVDVLKAQKTLEEYKRGKAHLENRVVDNEQWYKLRHWEQAGKSANPGDPEPTSAWLLNCIANKHADAMDNYPEPVVLPREEGDRETAQVLSSILPVILEEQRFEDTYDQMWWRKLKSGTGVLAVMWDKNAQNGLGDVAIRSVDLLSIYWEPGVNDINESRNIFVVTLQDNDLLEQAYPQLKGKLVGMPDARRYIYDDDVNTNDKSVVVDWYYKVRSGTVTLLHYCKFCGDQVLYASEDDPSTAQTGFYAHGRYPFVFDTLFRVEGSPAGFGWLDVCKSPQMYIDKMGQVILKHSIMAARPRWFSREDGGVNEAEYADWNRDFVHYSGANPNESIMPIQVPEMSSIYATILQTKVDELKETSGNRDFSQGGTTSGVTAASAIAALQEAGSKLSRDMLRSSYRAFQDVCYLALELIRQFYTEERKFRITGANGEEKFVGFSNRMIAPSAQGVEYGVDLGMGQPVFDIKVRSQKRNAFSTLSQNEMAKEFYSAGFFDPARADQALAALEMMDFEGKAQVQMRISQNGGMYQQLMQLTQIVNQLTGGALAQGTPGGGTPTQAQGNAITSDAAANSRESLANQARDRARNQAEVSEG